MRSKKIQYNQPINPPSISRTGYDFDGWYLEWNGLGGKLSDEDVATHDEDYYANWKLKQCEITFDANGGKIYGTNDTKKTIFKPYQSDMGKDLPSATLTGNKFNGWFT